MECDGKKAAVAVNIGPVRPAKKETCWQKMTKMQPIRTIIKCLNTAEDPGFVFKLDEKDLMVTTACSRERMDRMDKPEPYDMKQRRQ